jgi:hypothetical protein
MKKVGFRLRIEDGWPPYDAEFLWTEQRGEFLCIKSFPFFVKGIAFDDLIRVTRWEHDEVINWRMAKESNNSTIWIITHQNGDEVLDKIAELGCGYEGAPFKSLYSVNIPPPVDKETVESILNSYESCGAISVAYPAFRDRA